MSARIDTTRFLLPLLTAALAAVVVFGTVLFSGGAPAAAREWESETYNVFLGIPDAPAAWTWLPAGKDWEKSGIVKGATRTLDELKDGSKAKGEHGLLHLIIRSAEEEATLADIADDKATQKLLMGRFGSKSDWPEIEREETKLNDDLPAILFSVKGNALNAKTGDFSRCTARMLVTMALGKVYFLRMYAWHTEYDDEGLTLDLDMIEGDFELLKTKAKDGERPKRPAGDPEGGENEGGENGGGNGGAPDDEREAEVIDLREYQLRLTKHRLLVNHEPDTDDLILKIEGSDARGYYSIYIYAVQNSRVINGQQAPPENIKKWITTDWWKNFTPNHPEGEIFTFKWPKKTGKAKTFITLPDTSEDKRTHIAGGKKKTPVDPKASDVMKKMKYVEKVKRKNLGKKYKVMEPYRGILQGNRPRRGKEIIMRFAWRSVNHSFRMFVLLGGEADVKFGKAIRETLHSLEHYKD